MCGSNSVKRPRKVARLCRTVRNAICDTNITALHSITCGARSRGHRCRWRVDVWGHDTRQMMPVYNKYKSHITINFHPYGPTEETSCKKGNNGMECTCQHGKDECDKNALQACVLRHYPENALETGKLEL
ncbi:hypothetical protein TELCIR_05396 [Teladorsagia circumcincta]|uniref:Uncharacterized protein n=1 Tax=Teladorsagia circumcincta TaxID=45464 RepID=A0A2G9UR22_TELCI|nr:hypothetical protein TELCIR_05396 [Teladorsagia circumcincta]